MNDRMTEVNNTKLFSRHIYINLFKIVVDQVLCWHNIREYTNCNAKYNNNFWSRQGQKTMNIIINT